MQIEKKCKAKIAQNDTKIRYKVFAIMRGVTLAKSQTTAYSLV